MPLDLPDPVATGATAEAPEPVLDVRDLRTVFATARGLRRAVDGVSIQVAPGERVGLAGASGSGKTQILRAVLGLVDGAPGVIAGSIRLAGIDVLNALPRYVDQHEANGAWRVRKDVAGWRASAEAVVAPLRGRVVATVPQEPRSALVPYWTVAEHLRAYAMRAADEAPVACLERGRALLEAADLSPERVAERYPDALSGGEAQRLLVILTLMLRPTLILADEPFSMLDTLSRQQVGDLFAAHLDGAGAALLLVSHDLGLLGRHTTRMAILWAGQVVEEGATQTVTQKDAPHHPYTDLLRASSTTPGRRAASHNDRIRSGCPFAAHCPLRDALPAPGQQRCNTEPQRLKVIGPGHRVRCWAIQEGVA